MRKYAPRLVMFLYLAAILLGPLAMVFWRTFEHGVQPAWDALTDPDTIHAFKLTLIITAIAVPINTVFGIVCGLAIVRRNFPGKGLLNAFIDLPLALSPVVVGLALFLLYGREGWFGGWLQDHGVQVLFALPAMVIATIFVSIPFVAREVIPTLREIGDEQEQAARTLGARSWQTFWRITLPSIRWALIYGVILTTARCLGEYGAVAVVSGRLQGQTETATLRVQERYESFDQSGAYAISLMLAVIAVIVLVSMTVDPTQRGTRVAMSISIRNVSKRFGDFTALDDVSLEVETGSLVALLGPSGSGKSTLLRIIAGLERADSGEVLLAEEDVTGVAPQDRGIGFVFQHYAAFKHMTVWNNVAFGLKIRKRPKDEVGKRVRELLELVQLEAFADRYPSQLSGGQRQRMGLARALAVDPKVLLLDEPFGALDAQVRKELRAWLRRLHDETHTTTVIVTHDQEEAMEVAETVAVMNRGKVEQVAGPVELYEHPANEFVMEFVGAVNRLGDSFVRPHDLEIALTPNGTTREAMVVRLVHLGFDVRVELVRDDGEALSAQLTRDEAQALELHTGQIVYVRPTRQTTFAA